MMSQQTRDFFTVDFIDNHTGQQFFRLMTAVVTSNHKDRMAEFQEELGDRMTITAYMLDSDSPHDPVMFDTFWDRALVGAA
jgi:hypothetical protein